MNRIRKDLKKSFFTYFSTPLSWIFSLILPDNSGSISLKNEEFAARHSWEKTREVTRTAAYSTYEEDGFPIGTYVRGTLWTPTVIWVDKVSEADLFLKPKEEAIEEYENYRRYVFERGILYFTVTIRGMDKEEISLDNKVTRN